MGKIKHIRLLKESIKTYKNSSNLIPKIGIELEFFAFEKIDLNDLKKNLCDKFSLIYDVEKEQGENQIEIKYNFTDDLEKLCFEVEKSKEFIKKYTKVSFEALPFEDDCPNALQLNISLHKDDKNITKEDKKVRKNLINILLDNTKSIFNILAPNKEDLRRFDPEINKKLFKSGKYTAPTNLSYGNNNRTCAIRVSKDKNRIEYRVPCANCDIYKLIEAILNILNKNNAKNDYEEIYGNAFDEQYDIIPLCKVNLP